MFSEQNILQDKSEQLKTTTIKQAKKRMVLSALESTPKTKTHELRNEGEISW